MDPELDQIIDFLNNDSQVNSTVNNSNFFKGPEKEDLGHFM